MSIPTPEDLLAAGASTLGIPLDATQLAQFAHLCALLQQWNQRVNLTAIIETSDVYLKHFLDSLTPVPYMPLEARTLLDIGTGGGFPGLPIAIARPGLQVTLLEAHARKTAFLSAAVAELGLTNGTVVTGRAETEAHLPAYRETFDVTVTRAVDTLAVLAEYQLPFCRIGGLCIAMKKGDIEAEATTATHALAVLGGSLRAVHPVGLPELADNRSIVLIDKLTRTPDVYPRRPGIPAKRPL